MSLSKRGEKSPQSKLTEEKVKQIRNIYNEKIFNTVKHSKSNSKSHLIRSIAKDFNISTRTVRDIIHYRSWKCIYNSIGDNNL